MNSKTILHRVLLVMLLAILGAGCAPRDPANDPSYGSAPAQERREGKFILTAKLDGAAVVAVLARETLCRDRAPARGAVVVVGGAARARGNGGSWEPCGVSPVAGASLELGMNTPTKLVQSTNSEGMARFDLSGVEPTPELVRKQQAGVFFKEGAVLPAIVDLSPCPVMAGWKATIAEAETKQAAEKARQQAERAEQDAQAAHARMLRLLDQIEKELATIKPPWTDERVAAFAHVLDLIDSMGDLKRKHPVVQFSAADQARVAKVSSRMDSLFPGYRSATEAAQAKAAKLALVTGRKVVLATLRAPSTARFVGDSVLLQCASGYVVSAHDVDAQNGFGAMVRGRFCAKFNPTTQRIVVSGTGGGFSVDTSCDPIWLACDTLDHWKATVGF